MKTCTTCGVRVGRNNRSGYCNEHFRDSPTYRANLSIARKKWMANPENIAALRANFRAASRCEKARLGKSERCTRMRLWERGHAAVTPESRALGGKRQSDKKLAGIPHELRDEYRYLTKNKGIPAAEARAAILAQHETEMARFRREIGAKG